MKKIYYALPLLLFRNEVVSLAVVAVLMFAVVAWLISEAAKGGGY